MPRILIVAYGNPMRSDDGVAWRAADALEARLPSSVVEILRLHQLGPELAETASRSEYVIFIDAAADPSCLPGEIRVVDVDPEDAAPSRFWHAVSPQTVIGLSESLYGVKLKAIVVTATGENFDHGNTLSPAVSAAIPPLIDRIERIVRAFLHGKRNAPTTKDTL